MEGVSLKSRAVAFAICAGAIAFILAIIATSRGGSVTEDIAFALVPALLCGVMCWALAKRAIASTASAIDSAIVRLERAALGDLESEIPKEVAAQVPQLADAMQSLFQQLGANLDRVHRLAMYDSVTGLPNRINFRRSCERTLSEIPRDTFAALFFIDLDRFKNVNDTMGHAMGDVVLGLVASRLRGVADQVVAESATPPPLVGRLAGDEFTMFVTQLRDPQDAMRIATALQVAFGEPFDVIEHEAEIGASIGVALYPEHGKTLTDLMRSADAAMYHAKDNGRGRAEFFNQHLADRIADRAQMDSDLRVALDLEQFRLVFQPQVDMREGRIVAAEALLRWDHPNLGLTLPGTFIQRAEENGLIVEIGDWVIEKVADTIARWGRMGIEQRLAVNISPRQLDHAMFFKRLRAAMLAVNAPSRLLELEITETLAMQCSDEVVDAIAMLRADGASIAIDDFGTGYSNLPRLRQLRVDRIKLDRSLIEQIVDNGEARNIAHAVVGLIHGLGCQAVGKGVENSAQADVLRVIGCDVMQGHSIAEPMDEAAFVNWSRTESQHGLVAKVSA